MCGQHHASTWHFFPFLSSVISEGDQIVIWRNQKSETTKRHKDEWKAADSFDWTGVFALKQKTKWLVICKVVENKKFSHALKNRFD